MKYLSKDRQYHVYFHYIDQEVVYVGRSVGLIDRTMEHMRHSKWFSDLTAIKFHICASQIQMNLFEDIIISQWKPRYNRHIPDADTIYPFPVLELHELSLFQFRLNY